MDFKAPRPAPSPTRGEGKNNPRYPHPLRVRGWGWGVWQLNKTMALTKIKIGSFVKIYNENCNIPDLTPDKVSGINRDKMFFEPSRQVGGDTSKYKIVPPNYFACNLMHVGRDAVLPIALNNTDCNKIVSPAYTIFYISNENLVLKEYFYILLNSDEKDRYFWFNADASVRDGMSWEDFCNLELNVPSLPIQQKYVKVYKAMLANQKAYERGLEDLKLTCDAYIENLRKEIPCEPIGPYIEQQFEKNTDGKYGTESIKGISIKKEFIETKADMQGVSLTPYILVKPDYFAFVPVTSRNGEKITLSHNITKDTYIVSSSYIVFKVSKLEILDPDYLFIYFNRPEFDRYARFNSWGSARETFDWKEMQEVKIPIPDIKIQKSIVEIYKVYQTRKEINEKLKAYLKNICPILIKGSTEEAR